MNDNENDKSNNNTITITRITLRMSNPMQFELPAGRQ